MLEELNPPAIHGEAEAGEAAKCRKQLNALIKNLNASTFDLAEALYRVKKNGYFQPKFNTFGEYVKSLDGLKFTKAYYLCRIVESMTAAGVPRAEYEPLGIAKLRVIAKIEALKEYPEPSGSTVAGKTLIGCLVMQAADGKGLEHLKKAVADIKGETGDEAMVWLNVSIKQGAREVVKKAISVAKKQIGSVSTNDEGIAQDASDGRALELIATDFLSDPSNNFDQDALTQEDKNAS